MATTTHQRFKSGEKCRETGAYSFDGFTDGSSNPLPLPEESEITMSMGDTFPSIHHPNKPCYWRPSDMTRDDDIADARATEEGFAMGDEE